MKALVFVSKRCPYCFYFKSIVESLKRKFPEVEFEFVDVEERPNLAKAFDVEMLPTLVLVKDREVMGGIMGFVDEDTAESSLRRQLRT